MESPRNLWTKVKVLLRRWWCNLESISIFVRQGKSLLKKVRPDAVFNPFCGAGHLNEFRLSNSVRLNTLCIPIKRLCIFPSTPKNPYLHRIYMPMAVFICFWQLSRCTLVLVFYLCIYLCLCLYSPELGNIAPEYNCIWKSCGKIHHIFFHKHCERSLRCGRDHQLAIDQFWWMFWSLVGQSAALHTIIQP